jgi:5-methylcytosine-specific restriction endonuclease McrA
MDLWIIYANITAYSKFHMKNKNELYGFKPVTQGERLFKHLLKHFISPDAKSQASSLSFLQIGNRQEDFSEYYLGVFCFNLLARLIKKSVHLLEDETVKEENRQSQMIFYLQTQMEIAIDRKNKNDVVYLATLANLAAQSSGRKINPSTKALVTPKLSATYCYICGERLELASSDNLQQVQYEHIWPSNFGGDSDPENLLPACSICNNAKGSTLLWQDAHVHSFVLKPNPSIDEITRIQRREKIAIHRRMIFQRACNEGITLKEAALKIGPMGNLQYQHINDAVDFFNCFY